MSLFNLKNCMLFFLLTACVHAEQADHSLLLDNIERAYNFEQDAFDWFESDAFDKEDALKSFIAATASYWSYQSDRIDPKKRDHSEALLTHSIELAEAYYKSDKHNPEARFLYGSSRCNRARFHAEETSWFRAYLDAREGLGVLRDLVKDEPDYADGYFALGVAECFLSDAPIILKPLARLLGFSGSAEDGIEKLQLCIDRGEWTMVEARYYLAYYYYNVAVVGSKGVVGFSELWDQYPNNPLFAYFLGRSYQISNQPLQALAIYRESRDVAYKVGAEDIGNWSSFRVGTILQGEHQYQAALLEYGKLQKRLNSETHHREYFYLLPLKIGESLIAVGENEKAKAYLSVIRKDWDKDAYQKAKELLKGL